MELYESLKDYPELRLQYLFYNCFIISSEEMNELYERAKSKQIKKFNDVEIYYSPDYLYQKNPNNSVFEKINSQIKKKFYFLKEHIFYYQYLLLLIESKEKDGIKEDKISEISYRTLMDRLYSLYDDNEANKENYGINYIYNVPCIYTIIEPDIIKEIINMRKLNFELLKINRNKFDELFGINEYIENSNFIYNNSLISISLSNSTITEENNLNELDLDENVNKRNKDILQKEKFLINLSSELFLFDYITKQFGKSNLKQLPRMLFFCCVFDENMKDIYKLRKEKSTKNLNSIGNTEGNNEEKEKLNKIYEEIKNNTKIENQIDTNQENKKEKKEKKEKVKERVEKNLLKCQLLDFCGTLELDGAFKYIGGNDMELKSESLVIILSEFLNAENNIEKYIEKNEENIIINKIKKNQNDIEKLKQILSQFNMFKNIKKIEINKEYIEKVKKELEDKPKIIFDKKIYIRSNDIVLIESKREYPKNLLNEIRNFIEHSFYFITLYKNKKIIDNSSIIHLFFIYDHTRNFEDENRAYSGLNNIIKDNSEKLKTITNKIKLYLIHSLPNLNLSILDKLENNISDLTNSMNKQNIQISNLESENNGLKKLMNDQNNHITNLKSDNISLNNLMNKQNIQISNLESENDGLKKLMNEQNIRITNLATQSKNLEETIKKLVNRIDELEKKIEQNNNSDDKIKKSNNNKKNEDI